MKRIHSSLLIAITGVVGSFAAFFAGTADATAPATCGNAEANPALSVSQDTFPTDQSTTVTVSGSSYLVPPHLEGNDVFGGVYVFFGWVLDPASFGPSTRGQGNGQGLPGVTYAYPGEAGGAETRDDGSGMIRLVSFSGGGVSGEATPFHMSCTGGNWTAEMNVPGPVFTMTDPSTGQIQTFNCTTLAAGQCGFFSIGAHGVPNATNERFLPVTFAGASAQDPAEAGLERAEPVTEPSTTTLPLATTTTPTSAPTSSVAAEAVPVNDDTSSPDAEGGIRSAIVESRDVGSSVAPLIVGVLIVAGLIVSCLVLSHRKTTSSDQPAPG